MALGIVTHGWGDQEFSHQDYLRVRGVKGAYPSYSDDPLDNFRRLADDLQGPAAVVLSMTQEEFTATAAAVSHLPTRVLP